MPGARRTRNRRSELWISSDVRDIADDVYIYNPTRSHRASDFQCAVRIVIEDSNLKYRAVDVGRQIKKFMLNI